MVVLREGGFKSSTILRLRFRERGVLFIFFLVVGFPRVEGETLFNFLESADIDSFKIAALGSILTWNRLPTEFRTAPPLSAPFRPLRVSAP